MLADDATVVSRVTRDGRTMTRRLSKSDVEGFVGVVVEGAMDGSFGAPDAGFALGFCAALDMLFAGTLDMANPIGMVMAAIHDVADVLRGRRMVTDFLPAALDDSGAHR